MKTKLFNKAKGLMALLLLLTTVLSHGQNEDITVNITDASAADASDGCIELMVNFDPDAPNPSETGDIIPPFFYTWSNTENGTSIEEESNETGINDELCGYPPGTYFVTVTDGNGCNATGNFTINIQNQEAFTATIEGLEVATIGQAIDLFGSVNPAQTGNVTWEWEFGEGASPSTSLEQNPTNISYGSSGFKTVRLSVTNSLGQIATNTHQIYVEETALVADFDWFNNAGNNVIFSASVSGNFGDVTYEWNFGDGNFFGPSSSPNINNPYQDEGVYEVILEVCDNNGCVSVIETIIVGQSVFTVEIVSPTETRTVTAGTTVDFVAEATNGGEIVDYTWNFSGGASDDANMPCFCPETSATFTTPGCYAISVRATDAAGNAQDTKVCLVSVLAPPFTITGINTINNCSLEDAYLSFDNVGGVGYSDGTADQITNSDHPCFGEYIRYDLYKWTATSIDGTPLSTSLFRFSDSPCVGFDFTHPALAILLDNEENSFTFICKLEVRDLEFPSPTTSIYETEVTLYSNLIVEAEDITACPTSITRLGSSPTAQGGSGNYTYRWENIDDFSTPQELSCTDCPNPLVTVPSDGQVKEYRLVVTDRRYPLQDCVEERIVEVRGAALIADAGPNTVLACANNSLQQLGDLLGNTAVGGTGNYSYMWSPVRGLSDPTIANPIVTTSPTESELTYTLTVFDNRGCSATDEVIVKSSTSYPQAYAGIAQTEICYGEDIQLGGNPTGTGMGIVGDLEYQWMSPNNDLFSTEANPILPPFSTEDANGLYMVTVVDNANGCFNTSTVQVDIRERLSYENFSIALHNECLEDDLSGSAFTTVGDIRGGEAPYTYQWEYEDIVSDPHVLNPMMMPSAEHPFNKLVTYDAYGCLVYNHNSTDGTMPQPFIYSDIWVLDGAPPDIMVEVQNGILCASDEICVDVVIDRHFLSEEALEEFGTIFPNLVFDWRVRSSTGTIIEGERTVGDVHETEGIYYTQICFTIDEPGNYTFDLLKVENYCKPPISLSSDIFISHPSQDINFLQVCNNTGNLEGIETGVYAAHSVKVGGDCKAFVLEDFVVHTKSDNKINLLEGFHARSGSSFTAKIEELVFCEGFVSEEVIERSWEEIPIKITKGVKLNLYPNPFDQNLEIAFEIEDIQTHNITINILTITGIHIASLYKETVEGEGIYTTKFESKDLPSGIYLCEFNIDGQRITKKILKN